MRTLRQVHPTATTLTEPYLAPTRPTHHRTMLRVEAVNSESAPDAPLRKPPLIDRSKKSNTILPGFHAADAMPQPDPEENPMTSKANAKGKSGHKSLMHPQDLARRVLPRAEYERLSLFALEGCPTECGPPWEADVIDAARKAGPHVSAMTDDNVQLIWDDIMYQRDAGFIRIMSERELFGAKGIPKELKISRVAVVPQANRRGRIILNLSAMVDLGVVRATGRRRWKKRTHPSVNETTQDAAEQTAVKALGTALTSLLFYMFDVPSSWEIDWHKIDLSDGFWRMIVEDGKEYNFVFQLPKRKGDDEYQYVVPSSLQMGWKNSPAFFCTGTETTRTLIKRLLALTVASGIEVRHRHEGFCTSETCSEPKSSEWKGLMGARLLCRVYVDDFMNGLAGEPLRPERLAQQLWVARATLHGIHSIFPPPDVIHHDGGKDSISVKKLERGDARFKLSEVLLGFLFNGSAGPNRTIAVPQDKFGKYTDRLRAALSQKNHWIPLSEFQKIHGQMNHVTIAIPCLRGLMSPLNKVLSSAPSTVGLKQGSILRYTFETFMSLLRDAQDHPSHITELVAPDLPHYYGMTDASGFGAGGVWLPCTHWVQPTVWRFEWPPDIQAAIVAGTLSMVDCEFAAYFIAECMIDALCDGNVAGISTFLWTDNSATRDIVIRQASRATSPMPAAALRWLALRQRWTRRGPQDIAHWTGERNIMADFASRSFAHSLASFLTTFREQYPLPPQLGSWRCVRPSAAITSAVCNLLRRQLKHAIHPKTLTGGPGVGLPTPLARTLSSLDYRGTPAPTAWGEDLCSFPLLLPCGRASSIVAEFLRARRSRTRYAQSPLSWDSSELTTLGEQLQGRVT